MSYKNSNVSLRTCLYFPTRPLLKIFTNSIFSFEIKNANEIYRQDLVSIWSIFHSFSEHEDIGIVFDEFIQLSRRHSGFAANLVEVAMAIEQVVEVAGGARSVWWSHCRSDWKSVWRCHHSVRLCWRCWSASFRRNVDRIFVDSAKKLLEKENPKSD